MECVNYDIQFHTYTNNDMERVNYDIQFHTCTNNS